MFNAHLISFIIMALQFWIPLGFASNRARNKLWQRAEAANQDWHCAALLRHRKILQQAP